MYSKQLEIQDGRQYGRLLLGDLLKLSSFPNIQHRDLTWCLFLHFLV